MFEVIKVGNGKEHGGKITFEKKLLDNESHYKIIPFSVRILLNDELFAIDNGDDLLGKFDYIRDNSKFNREYSEINFANSTVKLVFKNLREDEEIKIDYSLKEKEK